MPNWCDNYIHLEGPSEEVKKLQEDFSSKGIVPELLKSNKIELSDFEKIHYCIIREGKVKYTIGKFK